MYVQALAEKEKALGCENATTITTIHNLANLYLTQSKLMEAEKMYVQALAGHEKAIGSGHVATPNMINDLDNLYPTLLYVLASHGGVMRVLLAN